MENRSTRAYHPMANGLVELHNKILMMWVVLLYFSSEKSVTIFIEIAYKRCKTRFIQFKKMNKMERQTGGQWDDLLQSVVLAMNSSVEKSTDQTPFKLME